MQDLRASRKVKVQGLICQVSKSSRESRRESISKNEYESLTLLNVEVKMSGGLQERPGFESVYSKLQLGALGELTLFEHTFSSHLENGTVNNSASPLGLLGGADQLLSRPRLLHTTLGTGVVHSELVEASCVTEV